MDAKMKHTPRPWKVGIISEPHGEYEIYVGESQANVDKIIASSVEGEANAHLIAAAPDIFIALNCMMVNVGASAIANGSMEKLKAEQWWITAQTAIAKATGAAS